MKTVLKLLTATAAAGCMMAAASAANATVTFTNIVLIDGSGIFGATTDEAGLFTHTFDFTISEAGNASSSVVTISLEGQRDIDFSAIDLDGNAYTLQNPDPAETWGLTLAALGAGLHTITLKGNVSPGAAGVTASYAGTLNINSDDGGGGNVIPEPATWAMMIMGFGGVGAMARSRRRTLAVPA